MKICNECREEVGDTPNDDPCPHCGAKSGRTMIAELPVGKIAFSAPAITVRYRQWNNLLDSARRFYDSGEYGVAVIVATTACEVVMERAMSIAFAAKGVPDLKEPVMDLLFTKAITRRENRDLYVALTGDTIQKKDFWHGYTVLVQRRNRTVHTGEKITQVDARADLDAAALFVGHVERHNGLV